MAPPIIHTIQPFDRNSVTALCDVSPNLLPERWRQMMLIHGGIHHRSRKQDPFAFCYSVPHSKLTHYIIYGIPSLPQSTVSTPSLNTEKTKFGGRNQSKTKKNKSDSSNSRTYKQIGQASQRILHSVNSSVPCDLVESENSYSHCKNIDSDHPQSTEVISIFSFVNFC